MLYFRCDNTAQPYRMPWKNSIAVGRGYEILRADLQHHLRTLQRTIGYEYIRFHGIFHDDVEVYRENANGEPIYTWFQVDKIFDALVDLGFKQIVELNPMPRALASGNNSMFWWQMNITPPKSFERWERFIQAFVEHLTERYGCETVSQWYFEVWNEPNLPGFWSGTQGDYWNLYDASARAIKRVDPRFRVGGPASSKCSWIADMIDHCVDSDVPLDFISTHLYGQDEYVQYSNRKCSPHDIGMFFIDTVKAARNQIRASRLPDLPLLFTEWNTMCGKPGRPVTWMRNEDVDSLFAAGQAIHLSLALDDTVDAFTWWVASDVFEESGQPHAPFNCQYGLLNIRGLPKASANAFSMLAKLTGKRMDVSSAQKLPNLAGAAGTTEPDVLRILLWNHVPNEIESPVTWHETIKVELPEKLRHLSHIQVIESRIGAGCGSAYETWLSMGMPENLTRSQEELLRVHSVPNYRLHTAAISDGVATLDIMLAPREVVLLEWHAQGKPVEKGAEDVDVVEWNKKMSDLSN